MIEKIATVTISIDLELAWGNWDNLKTSDVSFIRQVERPVILRLLEIFDRYNIPVTWAFVAALMDRTASFRLRGEEQIWYAPDVIDSIRSSKVKHELGSHGATHRYFDQLSVVDAERELDFARAIHRLHGLPFTSFVFPRNKVSKVDLLASYGIKVYRGVDCAWHERVRERSPTIGRAAHFIDKLLPFSPEVVYAEDNGDIVNLPGSMLFIGRGGLRRLISGKNIEKKLNKGVGAAIAAGAVFHLWLHPSNFWYETSYQVSLFEKFISMLSRLSETGKVAVLPMGAHSRP